MLLPAAYPESFVEWILTTEKRFPVQKINWHSIAHGDKGR